jgi:hypothetical protein
MASRDLRGTYEEYGMATTMIPALDATLRRRFTFFEHLGTLNHRGMHLIDPWTVGATLGFSHDETEYVLASLAQVGWIERIGRDNGERVALTVKGLARL